MTRPKGDLGTSVIRSRFGGGKKNSVHYKKDDINQGKSITEQSDLDELLHVAQLARTTFTAGTCRQLECVYSVEKASPLIVSELLESASQAHTPISYPEDALKWLRIPRRPKWDRTMDAQHLHQLEEESFLGWRRDLASIENSSHFILTPFERNLDMWRQLWRVIESCDVIVQVVDARNPLLYYCEDLITYINESGQGKSVFLLVNKADLLDDQQRESWCKYFAKAQIQAIFFSAHLAVEEGSDIDQGPSHQICSSSIASKDAMLDFLLRESSSGRKIGIVGYPNVGKSSTINSLSTTKRVSVAATPGKTKHFQTVVLDNGVTLYDCPGLVFPNFAASKSDLVLNGILPIDQLRDWIGPIRLLMDRIPVEVIQQIYGIELPKPTEDTIEALSANVLLSCFAAARGFMTSFHGNPDESRAARLILKDYVSGKLLFCMPPPTDMDWDLFNDAYRQSALKLQRKILKVSPTSSRQELPVLHEHGASVYMSGISGTKLFITPSGKSKKHYKKNTRA